MTRFWTPFGALGLLAGCSGTPSTPALHLTAPAQVPLALADGRVVHRPLAVLASRTVALPETTPAITPLLNWRLRAVTLKDSGTEALISKDEPGAPLRRVTEKGRDPELGRVLDMSIGQDGLWQVVFATGRIKQTPATEEQGSR